jgi:hypothetical protein
MKLNNEEFTKGQKGKIRRTLENLGIAVPTDSQILEMLRFFHVKGYEVMKFTSISLRNEYRKLYSSESDLSPLLPAPVEKPDKTALRILKSLKKAGYADPTEFLVQQALKYLVDLGLKPSSDSLALLALRLKDFKPVIVTAPKPTTGRKLQDLMILAASLSLEIPNFLEDATDETAQTIAVENLIRRASETLTEPTAHFSREIALRYGITFKGDLLDCFGFWEVNDPYCGRCLDREACFHKVKEASLGALANSAFRDFNIPEDFKRISEPLKILSDKSTSEGTLAALTDRKALLSWLDNEFPELTRVDYTETTNYQISNPYRKRLILLKIEKFTPRAYNVIFAIANPEQVQELALTETRHGFTYTGTNIVELQDKLRRYLRVALDIPAVSVAFSPEEEIKQEIQRNLTENWNGRIEHRTGYDVFVDTRGQKVLRFNRFSSKGFYLDFSRWGREKAEEYGLKITSSGARYEGTSKEELERLLNIYLSSLRSKHFSPRHPSVKALVLQEA